MKKKILPFYLLLIANFVQANTYYVSSSGNDGNSGLTVAQAWSTINKVNTFNFSQGDIISFEGGAIFNGAIYNPSFGNGVPGNPITLTSYGTGKATISSGTEEGFYLDKGNFTISNLKFLGSGYKMPNAWINGINIYIDTTAASTDIDNIRIDNVESMGYGGWGILMSSISADFGFHHVSVTNCLLHDNGTGGFQINGSSNNTTQSTRFSNSDVYVGYTKAYNNHGRLDYTLEWTGAGILVSGTVGGLVEYCEAYANGKENGSTSAGPVGIFLGDSKYVTIQHCKSHHNLGGPGKRDGGGFDLDQGSYGCVIQYCESYDNEGAGYGLYQAPTVNPWAFDTVRHNTSTNDGRNFGVYGGITFWGASGSYKVTNAKVYGNQVNMSKTGYGLLFLNNNLTNAQVHDNVFCLEPPASYLNYSMTSPIPSNATVSRSTFPCTVQSQEHCIPPTPGTITGPTNVCANLGGPAVTYSIVSVANAIGYNWTAPAGATITSIPPYSTSISVSYSNAFVPGNISVQALGTCANSAFKTLAVNKVIPATPGTITGPINVCTNIGGPVVTYSIASVINAKGYNWTVPAGATITSTPPYSTSISVSYSNAFVSGNVAVQALGLCGNSAFKSLAISKVPAIPGTITGPTNVCTNLGGPAVTYSIASVANAIGYNWTAPAGATITSTPPYSTSISVSYSNAFVSGNISVQSLSTCGNSTFKTLAVNKGIPATPVTITGPINVCANIGGPVVTYSIASVTNAKGYNWTVPAGATITSTPPYSTSISVSYSNAFVSGNLAVQALGLCGNSAFKSLAISKVPAIPGTITGPTNVCANLGGPAVTYSIASVANAIGYNWTVPAGAAITSTPPYSTSISVSYSNAFVSGNISVQSLSTCGNSTFKTLAINKGIPATPGIITGPINVCANIGGPAVTYSIASVTNAKGYNWTAPAGATILSTPPYSTSISVSYSNAFVSGNISVQASGTCGNSTFKTLAVNKVIPATPGIITGSTNVCANLGGPAVTYSIASVINAIGYNWTVPAGATITSTPPYSTSISVSYSNAFVSGNVAVQALGLCGNSTFTSVAISKVPAIPGTITGPTNVCANLGGAAVTYSIASVANAIGYNWTAPAGATITSTPPYSTSITVSYSNAFVSGNISVQALGTCGNSTFKTLAVNKGIPATPGTISGPSFVCSYINGAVVTYSIAAVYNATGYNWTVPTGATITSSLPHTNSITVSYTNSFNSGNLSVQALSPCGNSALKTLAVSKLAAAPSTLTGIISSCKYLGVPVTYTTTAVSNASSYSWTIPAGAVINGASTGLSISVTYPTAVSGWVTVKSNTNCGSSAAKSLSVSNIATPVRITGVTSVCLLQNQSYTVFDTANAANAVYTWTVPTGITIVAGQGTKTISVSVGSTFVSGSLSVKATACGITGSSQTLALTKNANCPEAIITQILPPAISNTALNIFPNPTKGDFTLSFNSSQLQAPLKIEILTATGQVISERTVDSYNGMVQVNISERKLSNGIYFVKCSSGKINQTSRLIVQR